MSRDTVGYGQFPPDPKWPGGAKVALNFVLNYEEGGENCLLHGDDKSENLLSEIVGASAYPGQRHANMESLYDFGARSGFWRLHRLLTRQQVPCTVFAVGMALQRNPDAASAMVGAGWEVASHGYRWIDYQNVDPETEAEHIRKTVAVHESILGHRPVGIYQGKPNVHTRSLVCENGGFLYDCDSYADELPYWVHDYGRPHLVVPYTLSENDMRFAIPNGFSHGGEFFTYLRDHLDYLVKEAREVGGTGRMMNVGLHCRLVGRAGRAAGLEAFIEHAKSYGEEVWICRRDQIAKHWYENHWDSSWGQAPRVPLHGIEHQSKL